MGLASPAILRASWGRILVEGSDSEFKDAKLYPGGAREWDWNETGTRHSPGIQPADVEELLDHGATTVILSRGYWSRLKVHPSTLDLLQGRGIQCETLETESAIRRYNELRESQPVGALIHSTC